MGQNAGVGRDNEARPNSSAEVCDGSIENGGGGDGRDFPGPGDRLSSFSTAPRFTGNDGACADRLGDIVEITVIFNPCELLRYES
jgi:hypothetical protein